MTPAERGGLEAHAKDGARPARATRLVARSASESRVRPLLLLAALAPFSLLACESREEKAVTLLEDMARAMEKYDGDCDKLASELTRLRKDNGDAMKALAESDKLSQDDRKAFDAKYQKRIDRAMQRMVEHAASCRDNPKIAEAMDVR